jgi:ribosomal protein L35AE/L33A
LVNFSKSGRKRAKTYKIAEGVTSPEEARFYNGKRVAFVYRAKREIRGSKASCGL